MQRFFGRGSEVLRFFSRGASSSAEKVQKCWCKLCDSAVCRGAEVCRGVQRRKGGEEVQRCAMADVSSLFTLVVVLVFL